MLKMYDSFASFTANTGGIIFLKIGEMKLSTEPSVPIFVKVARINSYYIKQYVKNQHVNQNIRAIIGILPKEHLIHKLQSDF